MQAFSQIDPRWKKIPLEKSGLTLGSHGCLVTSLTSGYSKFNPDSPLTPPQMLKLLDPAINDLTGNTVIPSISGKLAEKVGFKYVSREQLMDYKKIGEATSKPDQFVVFDVRLRLPNGKLGQHFVVVSDSTDSGIRIMDPLGGKFILWNKSGYDFKSFIIFEKLIQPAVVSDFAHEAVEWAKTFGVEDWKNPQEPITAQMADDICAKLKLSKDEEIMTKERLVTILHRLIVKV